MQLSERALAHELLQLQDKVNVAYLMLLAELCMKRKEYVNALEHIEGSLKLQHQVLLCVVHKSRLNTFLRLKQNDFSAMLLGSGMI